MVTSPNDARVAELITASNQLQRIAALADTDFIFNFNNATRSAQGEDGSITVINPANFPALMVGGGALGVGFIGPCGLNIPHVHPRANEIQLNIGGGNLLAQFIQENSGRVVTNTLEPGMATVFPRGAIHFQQNLGCEPVTFIASFDFVDAGVSQVTKNLLALNNEVVSVSLGNMGVDVLGHLMIPENIALGAQSCLDKCKINRTTFHLNSTFATFAASSGSSSKAPLAKRFPFAQADNSNINTRSSANPNLFAPGLLSTDMSFQHDSSKFTILCLSVALLATLVLAIYLGITGRKYSGSKMRRNSKYAADFEIDSASHS